MEPVDVHIARWGLAVPAVEAESVSTPVAESDCELRTEAGEQLAARAVREVSLITIVNRADPEYIGSYSRSIFHLTVSVEEQSFDAVAIHVDTEQVINDAEANKAGLLTGSHSRQIKLRDNCACASAHDALADRIACTPEVTFANRNRGS